MNERSAENHKVRKRLLMKQLRMKRKKLGLCPLCGRENNSNRSNCSDCLRKLRRWRRKKVKKGLCRDCSDISKPGYTLCSKHLGALRRRVLKRFGSWEEYWKDRKRRQAESLLNQYRLQLKDDNESLLKSEEFVRKFLKGE